jgi:hypothetical protein
MFPLSITLLSTADATNNENTVAFPGGSADSSEGYIAGPPTYGLPVRSGIGITKDGQSIFPTFNNLGRYTTQNIEGERKMTIVNTSYRWLTYFSKLKSMSAISTLEAAVGSHTCTGTLSGRTVSTIRPTIVHSMLILPRLVPFLLFVLLVNSC